MASAPRTRQDLQQETRDTLVIAARSVFAETGYHAASLEAIAREAGYSKGAVYSNFTGKADLFLAVMDANMAAAATDEGGWDLPEPDADEGRDCEPLPEQFDEAIQGMGLATLEFIAAAARDPQLRPEMARRMAAVTDHYAATASESPHDAGDPLSSAERGALLAALDQGTALLTLSGSALIDQRVLRTGLHRLLVPGPAETPREGDPGSPALHDDRVRQRLATAARADGWDPDRPGSHTDG